MLRVHVLFLGIVLSCCPAVTGAEAAKVRRVELRYGATLTGLQPGQKLRVWIPLPQKSAEQEVAWTGFDFPAPTKIGREPKYGNRMLHFATTAPSAGRVRFAATYRIMRREVKGRRLHSRPGTSLKDQRLFLGANRLVPISGLPVFLTKETIRRAGGDRMKLASALYQRVDSHMRYDKSKPGYGNGDVLWACDSRFGNCTDFHSLFISMARFHRIPARFEIGFPLPATRGAGKIGGYHCWASFYVNKRGWIPVDISEADKHPELKKYYFGNITENRISFSIGRDIQLVPQQAAPPLNYFVYPHVEVDGKVLPRGQISLQFSYRDVAK